MRVLVVTKLFPNAVEPGLAPFNRQQFAALARRPGVELELLATLPWFPGARLAGARSKASAVGRIPRAEEIAGLTAQHPRTLYVPKLPALSAPLYVASLLPEALARRGKVDVILASWAYPDGVAAVALGQLVGAPVVVKVHGSDLNVIAAMRGPRAQLRRMLPKADRVVAVSRGLADVAAKLGVARERIELVANGVDGELFRPRDRAAARAELGLDPARRWLVYVGRLEQAKGVLDLVAALAGVAAEAPELGVVLVGDGAARVEVERAVGAARLGERVILPGAQALERVPVWMAAADAVVLPSWAEGTPNVLLEALAAGRRCVATNVGGCPDVISAPELGELVPARDPAALGAALVRAARASYDPEAVARRSARGGWDESAARLAEVLARAIEGRRG